MSDKLREAAQAALDLLDNDDRDCAFAAGILRVGLAEPVGKFSKFSDGVWKEVTASSPGMLLYSAPPRKEWVGLTDEEIQTIHNTYYRRMGPKEFTKEIEAKLREKNT